MIGTNTGDIETKSERKTETQRERKRKKESNIERDKQTDRGRWGDKYTRERN